MDRLKPIGTAAIPRSIEKAERYRRSDVRPGPAQAVEVVLGE